MDQLETAALPVALCQATMPTTPVSRSRQYQAPLVHSVSVTKPLEFGGAWSLVLNSQPE